MFNTKRIENLESHLGVEYLGFGIHSCRYPADGELGRLYKDNQELRKALFLLAEQLGYVVDFDSPKVTVSKKTKSKQK